MCPQGSTNCPWSRVCMSHLSVMPCKTLKLISHLCVCGTQVHSGRVKRSSGKKDDELDLICHPCPKGSRTLSLTHTLFMPSITSQTKLHTYCFPRDINIPGRSVGMTDLWAEMLFCILKRPKGKFIIAHMFLFLSSGKVSFKFQLCLRCLSQK